MCLNFEILKEGVLMNNKNYGLNFNFITLRVKNIEKMRDYYLKLLKMKVLKDKKENGKREITLGTKTAPLIKMISFGNITRQMYFILLIYCLKEKI